MNKSATHSGIWWILGAVILFAVIGISLDLYLMKNYPDEIFRKNLVYLITTSIVTVYCYIVASYFKVTDNGGITHPQFKNLGFYIVPLLFPGLIFLNNANSAHITEEGGIFFVITMYVRVLMEEMMFRGMLQGYLITYYPKLSPWRVILISALGFALLHLLALRNPTIDPSTTVNQAVYAFMLGTMFSAINFRCRNIWLLSVIHCLLNLLATGGKMVSSDGINESASVIDYFSSAGSMALVFSPALLFAWIITPKKKRYPVKVE